MMREISMYIFDIFPYQIMYSDRSVSLNHIMRDIKCYIGDDNRIKDILLHVPCVDVNQYGKYMVRIDEFAVIYTDINDISIQTIRYDSYCEDPGVDSVLTIVEDTYSAEPFIRTTIGQKAIIEHIESAPTIEAVEPFWLRVNLKQDSFTPKDSDKPVLYYRLSVAENFV